MLRFILKYIQFPDRKSFTESPVMDESEGCFEFVGQTFGKPQRINFIVVRKGGMKPIGHVKQKPTFSFDWKLEYKFSYLLRSNDVKRMD